MHAAANPVHTLIEFCTILAVITSNIIINMLALIGIGIAPVIRTNISVIAIRAVTLPCRDTLIPAKFLPLRRHALAVNRAASRAVRARDGIAFAYAVDTLISYRTTIRIRA